MSSCVCDFSAVDHHIPPVGAAVNSEGTEGKLIEVHAHLLVQLCSGALLRSEHRESRPAFFYLATATLRARDLFRAMLAMVRLFERFFVGVNS